MSATIGQDPTLADCKLIAEPWDIGAYEVGDFPIGWSEWNGRFRDTVRDFWRGTEGTLPEFATRVSGSADLYIDGESTVDISFVEGDPCGYRLILVFTPI